MEPTQPPPSRTTLSPQDDAQRAMAEVREMLRTTDEESSKLQLVYYSWTHLKRLDDDVADMYYAAVVRGAAEASKRADMVSEYLRDVRSRLDLETKRADAEAKRADEASEHARKVEENLSVQVAHAHAGVAKRKTTRDEEMAAELKQRYKFII